MAEEAVIVNQPPSWAAEMAEINRAENPDTPVTPDTPADESQTPITPETAKEPEKPIVDTPEAKVEPTVTEPKFSKEDYFKELVSKAGVEVQNEDEFVSRIQEWKKPKPEPENPFANSYVAKLNEYVKQGGTEAEFHASQSADLDGLLKSDADQLIFLAEKLDKGKFLSDDEIRLLATSKYQKASPEERELLTEAQLISLDTREKLQEIQKKQDAIAAYEKLKQWQVEKSVPDAEKIRQQQEAHNQQVTLKYEAEVAKLPENFKALKWADGKETPVVWKDEKGNVHPTTAKVVQAVQDPVTWAQKNLLDAEGNFDPNKIARLSYIEANWETLANGKATVKASEEVKKVIDKIENPSIIESAKPDQQPEKQPGEDIAQRYYGSGR